MRATTYASNRHQQGSTLLVAIVLLLLAGLMGLMAMNVGIFEQRSSGNDLRAKVVKQVAEAGLAQGFEYLFRANPAIIDNTANWELCGASDETFPCGAVPAAMRASMYRLKANVGGYTDAGSNPLATALTQFMLPNSAVLPAMGAFDVAYGVAPVLCRVPLPVSSTTITCATDMNNLSDRRVVTFVSVSQIRGDAGRTTLTQTVSRSSLLAQPNGVPAVVATGSVSPNGGGDIVAMPDAGGPGIDISVWTRKPVNPAAGAFGTCDRQEWLASCEISLSNTDWMTDGSVDNGCTCDKAKKSATPEGWDILDADGNAEGINKDVLASEFPCDLFEFAFGVKTREDTNSDFFCEKRLPASVPFTAPGGSTVNLYPDEAFLYSYATKIVGGDASLTSFSQANAPALGPSTSGLVWCLTECIKDKVQIGTPENPVIIVVDGEVMNHATIFGLVFVRDPGTGDLSPTTGGAAEFKFNAQSAVFGSVLVQGVVPTGSGGGLIFGDRNILVTLGNNAKLARFDTLRGGWTDSYSY